MAGCPCSGGLQGETTTLLFPDGYIWPPNTRKHVLRIVAGSWYFSLSSQHGGEREICLAQRRCFALEGLGSRDDCPRAREARPTPYQWVGGRGGARHQNNSDISPKLTMKKIKIYKPAQIDALNMLEKPGLLIPALRG